MKPNYKITDDIEVADGWVAKQDVDAIWGNVTVGKFYKLNWCSKEKEYYVLNDEGLESLIYLGHEGVFVKIVE